jgi:hypothetical protein
VAITHQKLADHHSEVLKHLVYSPDLALLGYFHFHDLKKHHKRRKFSSTEEATLAADGWFTAQPKRIFLGCVKKLEQWSDRVWSSGSNI